MPKQNAKKSQRDKGVKDFENLPPLNQNAAGIDVGNAEHHVALSSHPCLPRCWSQHKQQGRFAPRTLLRFIKPAASNEHTSSKWKNVR
jgi:hypothetical protein